MGWIGDYAAGLKTGVSVLSVRAYVNWVFDLIGGCTWKTGSGNSNAYK